MSRTFKTVDYDQVLELTVRLGDCLPSNHLARFVAHALHKVAARGDHAVDKRELALYKQGETKSVASDHWLKHAKRGQLDLVPCCLQALPQCHIRLDIATRANAQFE